MAKSKDKDAGAQGAETPQTEGTPQVSDPRESSQAEPGEAGIVPEGTTSATGDAPATPAKKPAKVPAKMEQVVNEDGDTLTFKFRADPEPLDPIEVKLSEFPDQVQKFYAYFGMRTKLRNFTVPDADEAEASPTKMREKLLKGVALLKAGHLRTAREAGEKRGGGTLLLEAAMHYRRRKAGIEGKEFTETLEDVSAMLEKLTDEQVEQLKSTKLFQLAMQDAKDERAKAKRAQLEADIAKEASAAAM